MNRQIEFEHLNLSKWIPDEELKNFKSTVNHARDTLVKRDGAGNDFTGWLDHPVKYDKDEFERILKAAEEIRQNSDVLLVVGIGGSYLGARAAIEFLHHSFFNSLSDEKRKAPHIYFCGNSNSSKYLADLEDMLEGCDFSVNVISKSGTTTESAVAFRIIKKKLEEKYGKEEAAKRVYATTDKANGALKKMADKEGYTCFVIPDDIGGRYSVLTAVGLLPIAVSGADIKALMQGAADMRQRVLEAPYEENPSLQYAACRNLLLRKGKEIELLANYEPSLHYFSEWWKQLYGESEGKDGKGIFPASVDFTTDLHSMGQWIQDGERTIFETVISVAKPAVEHRVPMDAADLDGINYLAGKRIDEVNKMAELGTKMAHVDGGVPNMHITLPAIDEHSLGQLIYFFEKACGISGYLLGVNPFNQPGVEAYKKNMFKLLKKPGY